MYAKFSVRSLGVYKPYGEIHRSARAHVLEHLCHDTWKSLSQWVSTHIPNFHPICPAVSELQTQKFVKFKDGVCTCARGGSPLLTLLNGWADGYLARYQI